MLAGPLPFRFPSTRRSLPLVLGLALAIAGLAPASAGLDAGEFPAFVFVNRLFENVPDPNRRSEAIERATWGRLLIREADGTIRELSEKWFGFDASA